MATVANIELQSRRPSSDEEAEPSPTTPPNGISDPGPNGHNEFSLPSVDGGKDAWMFLGATFVLEALVWGMCNCSADINLQYVLSQIILGFPFAFGVFQDYYRSHEPFAGSSGIVAIGTCALVRLTRRKQTGGKGVKEILPMCK